MKYYIIKPKTHDVNTNIQSGIAQIDREAQFVKDIRIADICIMQKGWTKSRSAVSEYNYAQSLGIQCKEGYLYTDKYSVHLN